MVGTLVTVRIPKDALDYSFYRRWDGANIVITQANEGGQYSDKGYPWFPADYLVPSTTYILKHLKKHL